MSLVVRRQRLLVVIGCIGVLMCVKPSLFDARTSPALVSGQGTWGGLLKAISPGLSAWMEAKPKQVLSTSVPSRARSRDCTACQPGTACTLAAPAIQEHVEGDGEATDSQPLHVFVEQFPSSSMNPLSTYPRRHPALGQRRKKVPWRLLHIGQPTERQLGRAAHRPKDLPHRSSSAHERSSSRLPF